MTEMLGRLTRAEVDFVVIGGVALILLGSPRLTRDLDIVFAPENENLEALGHVLQELDATLREADPDLPFVPDAGTLLNVTLLTLDTSAGWLDVHREVDGAPPYDQLRQRSETMDVGEFKVRVASVGDMIAMKRAAGRTIDLADIEELEAMKRLRARKGRPRKRRGS